MRNTEARLKCLYGEEARFSFALAEDQTAAATLVLPALGSNQTADEEPCQATGNVEEESKRARVDRG